MSTTTQKHSVVQSAAMKYGGVTISSYIQPGKDNFGYEKYGMVVADNVKHKCGISEIGGGGITKIYVTGLNENAPEIKALAAMAKAGNKEKKEEYEARVKEIRQIVARAERELMGNYDVDPNKIDVYDDTFWSKVKTFHSIIADKVDARGARQETYWDKVLVEVGNDGLSLDENKIEDLLIIKAIEAGGISSIAPSYEAVVESRYHKFYLDRKSKSAAIKVSGRKLRDQAGKELSKLDKDYNKLFYVTKLVSKDSMYYKMGGNVTPGDILYEECSKFVDGEGMIKSKEEACTKFLDICKMDMEELKYRCMIQDATTNRYLVHKPDGMIYHILTGAMMGKTISDCLVFLRDPLNQEIMKMLLGQCEKDWTM